MKQEQRSTGTRPVLLLDEAVYGLEVYFKDAGYETEKVPQSADDGEVVKMAKRGNLIVVTTDNQLVRRLRVQNLRYVDISFEAMFPAILEKVRQMS